MYHSKTIGVFISHIFGDYQKNVCQGIIDKSLEYGYTAELFTSIDGEDLGPYSIGEEYLLNIPDFDALDGVIFVSGTYLSCELRDKILLKLQTECHCPIVEIAVTDTHFPHIVLENDSATRLLTEHLITEHNCRRICYLGCSGETYFSDRRRDYYKEAMAAHGLPVAEDDISFCDYTEDDVRDALARFTRNGKPDAVVCYNDRMALLFLAAALAAGYRVPEDIAITGGDDTAEGTSVGLTSVSFPVYEMGASGVTQLIALMQGNEIPPVTQVTAAPVFRHSCGCKSSAPANPVFLEQQLNHRIASLEGSILDSLNRSAAFGHVTDLDDAMDLLERYVLGIRHCTEFYLCLYDGWDSISSHILELTEQEEESLKNDTVILKFGLKNKKRLPECSYQKTSPLPDYIYENSTSAYTYAPLFFDNHQFGYIALAYENNQIDVHFQLIHWIMNITQMLEHIYEAKENGLLVAHLEEIYMKDALTGLYNKHGYNHFEELLIEQALREKETLTCFLFDLDGLKWINDNFGHQEGDFALQVIGNALKHAIRQNDICARFSGDEFYLLTCGYTEDDAKDLTEKVEQYLENYNRLSTKKYPIRASFGYASITPDDTFLADDLKEVFDRADKQMYSVKEKHHRSSPVTNS